MIKRSKTKLVNTLKSKFYTSKDHLTIKTFSIQGVKVFWEKYVDQKHYQERLAIGKTIKTLPVMASDRQNNKCG
jgi:predicted phosphohydrolase